MMLSLIIYFSIFVVVAVFIIDLVLPLFGAQFCNFLRLKEKALDNISKRAAVRSNQRRCSMKKVFLYLLEICAVGKEPSALEKEKEDGNIISAIHNHLL